MTEYLQEISAAVRVISTFDKQKTESQLIQGKMSTFIKKNKLSWKTGK